MGDDEAPSGDTVLLSQGHLVGKSCEPLAIKGAGKGEGLEIENLLGSA